MGIMKQGVFIQSGSFTDVDTTPQYPGQLGQIVYDAVTDSYYQYVMMSATAGDSDTTAPAATLLARWKDSDSFTICSDYAVAEGGKNSVAGVFVSAITAGKYGWIKKGGKATVANDGTAAVGTTLVDDGTDNGTTTAIAMGTAPTCLPVGVVVSVSAPYTSTAPQAQLTLIRR